VDDRFFTAYFPSEATICGRRLVAFTPFHYLILKAIGSPFLKPDGINGPSDLLAAIAVCQNTFGKTVRIKPTLRDAIWKLRMMRNASLFRREAVKFSKWMGEHSSGPKFWEVVSGGPKTRDLTGPDVLTLVIPVLMKTSITESEAWNMSLGRLQWISAEISEIEGSTLKFYYEDQFPMDDEDDDLEHALCERRNEEASYA
jgi:hypothetical protein